MACHRSCEYINLYHFWRRDKERFLFITHMVFIISILLLLRGAVGCFITLTLPACLFYHLLTLSACLYDHCKLVFVTIFSDCLCDHLLKLKACFSDHLLRLPTCLCDHVSRLPACLRIISSYICRN